MAEMKIEIERLITNEILMGKGLQPLGISQSAPDLPTPPGEKLQRYVE